MATPSVTYRVTGDGWHEIGTTIEGAFVPFARLSADRVRSLVEREEDLAARAKAASGTSSEGEEG